jgi:hypothetical protein
VTLAVVAGPAVPVRQSAVSPADHLPRRREAFFELHDLRRARTAHWERVVEGDRLGVPKVAAKVDAGRGGV